MQITNVYQAKARLSTLINSALAGDDVFISKAGVPKVKLVPVEKITKKRKPGILKGKIRIAKDFDVLPTEIAKAFGME